MEFLNELPSEIKLFRIIAIPISLIFLVSDHSDFLWGSGGSDGNRGRFCGDLDVLGKLPFQLFPFSNLINFLLGFAGQEFPFVPEAIPNTSLLIFGESVGRFCFCVIFFFFIIRQFKNWEEDNTFQKLKKTINQNRRCLPGYSRQNARGKGQNYGQFKWLRARAWDAMTGRKKSKQCHVG